MNKSHCVGCYNDVYNHGLGGAKQCWSFDESSLEKRYVIPVNMEPPYRKAMIKLIPNCFIKEGFCFVKPSCIDDKGYWND